MRIPILDSTLNRDMKSRGLIETDFKKVEDYRAKSRMLNKTKAAHEEINNIKQKLCEIDDLKNDLAEIKTLLKSIVNKD